MLEPSPELVVDEAGKVHFPDPAPSPPKRWWEGRYVGPVVGLVLLIALVFGYTQSSKRADDSSAAATAANRERAAAEQQLRDLFKQVSGARADAAALREQLTAAIAQLKQLGVTPVVTGVPTPEPTPAPAANPPSSSAPRSGSRRTPPTTRPPSPPPSTQPPPPTTQPPPPTTRPPIVCVGAVCVPSP